MKAVIQVVNYAKVSYENQFFDIKKGLLVFLGIKKGDGQKEADFFVKKLCELRIFEDNDKKLNLSLEDIKGEILLIPNFTVNANAKKGRRPDYFEAEIPQKAEKLFNYSAEQLNKRIVTKKGFFGCDMRIENEMAGPVTIILEKLPE